MSSKWPSSSSFRSSLGPLYAAVASSAAAAAAAASLTSATALAEEAGAETEVRRVSIHHLVSRRSVNKNAASSDELKIDSTSPRSAPSAGEFSGEDVHYAKRSTWIADEDFSTFARNLCRSQLHPAFSLGLHELEPPQEPLPSCSLREGDLLRHPARSQASSSSSPLPPRLGTHAALSQGSSLFVDPARGPSALTLSKPELPPLALRARLLGAGGVSASGAECLPTLALCSSRAEGLPVPGYQGERARAEEGAWAGSEAAAAASGTRIASGGQVPESPGGPAAGAAAAAGDSAGLGGLPATNHAVGYVPSLEDASRLRDNVRMRLKMLMEEEGLPLPDVAAAVKGDQLFVRLQGLRGADLAHVLIDVLARVAGGGSSPALLEPAQSLQAHGRSAPVASEEPGSSTPPGAPAAGATETGGPGMPFVVLQAWDSAVARQVTVSLSPSTARGPLGPGGRYSRTQDGLTMSIFIPLLKSTPPEIEFRKSGAPFSEREVECVARAALLASTPAGPVHELEEELDRVLSSLAACSPTAAPPAFPPSPPPAPWQGSGRGGGIPSLPPPADWGPLSPRPGPGGPFRASPGGARGSSGPAAPEEGRGRGGPAERGPGTAGTREQDAVVLKAAAGLQSLGARVFGLESAGGHLEAGDGVGAARGLPQQGRRRLVSGQVADWEGLAGYEDQKRQIEDIILLALMHPDIYDSIARATRKRFETNRPKAVLFEGPPGTGKTSCARVISKQASLPLVYLPLEAVASKYYGESEHLLASVFSLTAQLGPSGALLFLDEIDALATARDSEMHEVTRRILSVLLREMDGFDRNSKVVVIAATNRTEDLDPALLSRFDATIRFPLPNLATRAQIFGQYAQHLSPAEMDRLATAAEGMSGRDIRDICEQAERRFAAESLRKLLRSEGSGNLLRVEFGLPSIDSYLEALKQRSSCR